MFRYLDLAWDRAGHQPVIKRLFKWAEEQQNDELMAAFATGCDRLVRRVRQKRWQYDRQTRSHWEDTVLVAPRDVLPAGTKSRDYRNPRTGQRIKNVPLKSQHGVGYSLIIRGIIFAGGVGGIFVGWVFRGRAIMRWPSPAR